MPFSLEGQRAVVTGASRGIGLEIARALIAEGVRVAMVARSANALRDVHQRHGDSALPIVCDVAVAADVERALSEIQDSLGTPDILVNNAGAFALAPVGEMVVADAERLLKVNLLAPYAFANAIVPLMRARGSGHIVTIGSIADRTTLAENAVYAAGKFGVRAMHQVMRAELRNSGVRVSLISPGAVDTPLWDPIDRDVHAEVAPRAQMLRAAAVADAVLWAVSRPADVNVDELRLTRS